MVLLLANDERLGSWMLVPLAQREFVLCNGAVFTNPTLTVCRLLVEVADRAPERRYGRR
jgi:hypothetical protein